MAKYYQDFVGLNTFMYEANGWYVTEQSNSYGTTGSAENPTTASVGYRPLSASVLQNHLGWFNTYWNIGIGLDDPTGNGSLPFYKNFLFLPNLTGSNHAVGGGGASSGWITSSFFNALMTYRNGPYGFPSWKQVRVGQNPLTRKQRLHNIFTYVEEPGRKYQITINSKKYDRQNRYGAIKVFKEPPVVDSYKPLRLIGGANFYNPKTNMNDLKTVEVKASFGNEIAFFVNDEVNRYYNTTEETDDNYEQLKDLYLNEGMEDAASPIESFNMLLYRQTVFPKLQYAYLNKTRTRPFFVNTFWRGKRIDRTERNVSNKQGTLVPSQSMWPLDVGAAWSIRTDPTYMDIGGTTASPARLAVFYYYIGGVSGGNVPYVGAAGGFNTGRDTWVPYAPDGATTSKVSGGAGILMNSYSQFARGWWATVLRSPATRGGPQLRGLGADWIQDTQQDQLLTASCFYSRRHTLNPHKSLVSPGGMDITELITGGVDSGGSRVNEHYAIPTQSCFEGLANWDAGAQAGKMPFYDSYDEYAQNIRIKGKGYSIVPEFRISSHVETYQSKGVTEELKPIFELSGAFSANTTTSGSSTFYTVLSNTDFLKHFDLIKKDHKDFTAPAAITLKCKAIKKFLPYEGFYPCQRTVQMAERFRSSYSPYIKFFAADGGEITGSRSDANWPYQNIITPLFAPGALFNTIKAGVACDYPVMFAEDGILGSGSLTLYDMGTNNAPPNNVNLGENSPVGSRGQDNIMLVSSSLMVTSSTKAFNVFDSAFSKRIPFEALIHPREHLSQKLIRSQETHPYSLAPIGYSALWSGEGDNLYSKMANNFLAEVPSFFLKNQNFNTLTSLESSNPEFGNAISGNYYTMRIKMYHSLNRPNDSYHVVSTVEEAVIGTPGVYVTPPQTVTWKLNVRETLTMYSRPTAFGPPSYGGGKGRYAYPGGTVWPLTDTIDISGSDSMTGYNFPYTPPYYHGEGWCDLIFEAKETKKHTVTEIMASASLYPYYTRFCWPAEFTALRDLTGGGTLRGSTDLGDCYYGKYRRYLNSPWKHLIDQMGYTWTGNPTGTGMSGRATQAWNNNDTTPIATTGSEMKMVGTPPTASIQHPAYVDFNAMQIDSSVNLFGKAIQRSVDLSTDASSERVEVFSDATNEAKTRWVIQPKFETPILNFNKYSTLGQQGVTKPLYASASVPRGMWHQYGEIPTDPATGIFLQVDDIPKSWLRGQLAVGGTTLQNKVKSLADLCGFDKTPVKLGVCGEVKEISEAVVAVPFVQEGGTRKFFSIPRRDIDDTVSALRREVEPGVFMLGGPPKVGDSIIDMVKKMQRYVFPPSMDFVRYSQINPFAMYIFEFKHNLSRQDLADIWQNLPPTIGTSFDEAEATISHELLAQELLGGGSVIQDGTLDENAEGSELPVDIQWMIFKAKRRAATNYFDKVIQKTGVTPKSPWLSKSERQEDKDKRNLVEEADITYNWPYDFFSLVELVKLDAEIVFSNLENDDKGKKVFKVKRKMPPAMRRERKEEAEQTQNALGTSGAPPATQDDPSLLEQASDWAQDLLAGVKERRAARKAGRKEKRAARKEKRGARKEARGEKKAARKEKRAGKKKGRKDKRAKRKKGRKNK